MLLKGERLDQEYEYLVSTVAGLQVTSYEANFQIIFSRLVLPQQEEKRYSRHHS